MTTEDMIEAAELVNELRLMGYSINTLDLPEWEKRGALPMGHMPALVIGSPCYYPKALSLMTWLNYWHEYVAQNGLGGADVIH